MVKVAFKDMDGDLLHISHVKDPFPYTDGSSKYHNTYCLEIEMVKTVAKPSLYFTAEQLHSLTDVLTMAAMHLETKMEEEA